jgi:TRAP-type mannitol/chloroaromatic compound transport system permease small subunit
MLGIIGKTNEWLGKAASYLLVAMMGTICYEVVVRYFFGRPTTWSLELNTYLLCYYCMLGGGFTLLRDGHVSVDIVYGRFSTKTKAILSCVTSIFFFMFAVVLLWTGVDLAYDAFRYQETSGSILDWPLFPSKVLVPVGAALLLLQGIVKFINDLVTAITGKPLVETQAVGMFDRKAE